MSDDAVIDDGGGGDDIGTIVLMLGLYLIVLAFFILLNAISESSKERRDLVVESVNEGFDFREEGEGAGSDDTDITFQPLYDALYKEIEGILQANLPVGEYDLVVTSNRVKVSFKSDDFFFIGEPRINPDRILFFDQLGAVIANPKGGMGVETQVVVRTDETSRAIGGMDAFELAGRRAALFTRALIDAGVSPTMLSAGAYVDMPRIVLNFTIFVKDMDVATQAALDFQKVLTQTQSESGLTP